jgi:hypothetical protein
MYRVFLFQVEENPPNGKAVNKKHGICAITANRKEARPVIQGAVEDIGTEEG